MCFLCKILILKNTDPKNQIILFFYFDSIFFAVDQKINLVLPYTKVYSETPFSRKS